MEKKILNAKIFEYHKDILKKTESSLGSPNFNRDVNSEAKSKVQLFYSLKDLFSRDKSLIENKVFRIANISKYKSDPEQII